MSNRNEKILKICYLDDPGSLDPRFGYEVPANHTIKMLFEGLMRYVPDGTCALGIAEKVDISEDGKIYRFYLKKTLWSNGSPLTAKDFEYSWKSIVDPALPTLGSGDFFPIKNARAIVRGELPIDSLGVKTLNPYLLEVELEYPYPAFLHLVATALFSPVPQGYSQGEELLFNGPFLLDKWVPSSGLSLKANPNFWNQEKVYFEGIDIAIIGDEQTQVALFEKGKIDWLGKPFSKLPLDGVESLEKKGLLQHAEERAVYLYFINTEKEGLDRPDVRRALSFTLNRNDLTTHVLKEGERPAYALHPLLNFIEEGVYENITMPSIDLSYCNIEVNRRMAQSVGRMWEENLKVPVHLHPGEWTQYYASLISGNFSVGGLTWHSRVPDPLYDLEIFETAQDPRNLSNWENRNYQMLLQKARKLPEGEKRSSLLKEAQTLLMQEMPAIPVYFLTMTYGKNPKLKDVYLSPYNLIDFTYSYIEN